MHRVLVASLLGVVMMISGCSGLGKPDYKIHQEEQETDYSTVYAEVVEFDGFKNEEYQSELNMSVHNDVLNAIEQFDSLALEAKESLPAGVRSALKITQDVKRIKDGIISLVSEHYIYLGGAHGNSSYKPLTVDINSEVPHNLKLSELFEDEKYADKINFIIEQMVQADPQRYSELWAKPHISGDNEDRFYLTDTELVIYFPPYELSYYAKGFVEFNIPLSELSPILNERYRPKKQ